jgi:hypothetical protein
MVSGSVAGCWDERMDPDDAVEVLEGVIHLPVRASLVVPVSSRSTPDQGARDNFPGRT